ncbi:MAG: preprotein translocase subunit SecG [Salinivirgaceae bacterium]|jgi:preprotein translocase subunit SecG|nr:preprotein translocase subunit SecG [Salinivirgaceae bacterium]
MYYFISVLIIVVAILLVLIVLVQNSKGGGLAANFAGNNQVMGVRKTADFLEKATWALIGVFFILNVLAVYTMPKPEKAQVKSELEETINLEAPIQAPVPESNPTPEEDNQ